jgi:hypothetical protein
MKIILPLFVMLPRKTMPPKKYIVNLNNYRNWHYIVSNMVKAQYAEEIKEKLAGFKFRGKIVIKFYLFKGSRRTSDRSNVLCIQEKFFCDALVHCGCLPDDSDEFIDHTEYYTGCLDKENPRVEAEIIQIEYTKK